MTEHKRSNVNPADLLQKHKRGVVEHQQFIEHCLTGRPMQVKSKKKKATKKRKAR